MYHLIVRNILIQGFRDLSDGNYEAVLKRFAPDVHFFFEGDHALGSELHSREAVRQWFQRVFRIFPGLQFKVRQVIVSGWPWDTTAVTQLQVQITLKSGSPYQNSVVQIVRLRWGQVVDDYLLENTQKLISTLKEIAQLGNEEAVALAIKDQ